MDAYRLCCVSLVIMWASSVRANVGIYFGSGHTLKLKTSSQIQLVSEDVSINAFPWSAGGSSHGVATYIGQYVLKNLTSELTTIKVGFPIDSDDSIERARTGLWRSDLVTELVLNLGFIARDETDTYHVGLGLDAIIPSRWILHWKMTFGAHETRKLTIRYQLPIAFELASARRDPEKVESLGDLEKALGGCLIYHVDYITETGASWAGLIEGAVFRVNVEPFRRYLEEKTFAQLFGGASGSKWPGTLLHLKPRVFIRAMPDGWRDSEHGLLLSLKDYKPGPPVSIRLIATFIPNTPEALGLVIQNAYGPKPRQDELMRFREILLAAMGKPAVAEDEAHLVEQFLWYRPNERFSIGCLAAKDRAILEKLDALIEAARSEPTARRSPGKHRR